jgi:hypothetical protein
MIMLKVHQSVCLYINYLILVCIYLHTIDQMFIFYLYIILFKSFPALAEPIFLSYGGSEVLKLIRLYRRLERVKSESAGEANI